MFLDYKKYVTLENTLFGTITYRFLAFFRLNARKCCFLVENRTKYFFGLQGSPEIGIMCPGHNYWNKHDVFVKILLSTSNKISIYTCLVEKTDRL